MNPMRPDRRSVILTALAAAAAPRAALAALDAPAARVFIEGLIRDLEAIVKTASAQNPRADEFLALFRSKAALPEIGRFTMGPTWRAMSEQQRGAFIEAFEVYASRMYSSRVGEYDGQTLEVIGAEDAGRRGFVVRTLYKERGQPDIAIDWLVSDRSGAVKVSDIIAEGVSLSITQREEFAAMLERRGGDIDRFIADLAKLGS